MPKKDYDKTLTRLMSILTYLSDNRFPNTKELATEFNVTTRTIQKDIYRRLISFPIEKNSDGKFQFVDGFSLNKSLLTPHEMILISLSLSQFDHVNNFNKTSSNILKKLLYPRFFNPYFIKQNELESLNTDSNTIKLLERVIEDKKVVLISFDTKEIEVEPYKIANFDGFWYLFARDIKDTKIKTFMISKIKKITPLKRSHKTAQAHIEQTLNHTHSAWFEDGEGYEVIIKVYSEIAHYFKQKDFLQSQRIIEELDDGSLHISFEVTHDEDIDNMIKSWLPHIEVIKPTCFREKIVSELENYLKRLS